MATQSSYDLLDAEGSSESYGLLDDVKQGASQESYDLLDAPTTTEPEMQQTPEQRKSLAGSMTHEPFEKTDYSVRSEIVTENLKKGWAGFASLPGYAVDAVQWALDDTLGPALRSVGYPIDEPPVGGSEQIRQGYDMLLQRQDVEPKNAAEEYAGKAAEFVGAGGPMSMRLLGTEAIRLAGTNLTKQQVASELTKTFATDISSGAMAGIGAENFGSVFAQWLGEDWRAVGETLGGIGGGAVPWYAKNVTSGAANIRSTAKDPEVRNALFENRAKQEIEEAMGESPLAKENIEEAMQLQEKIPGFNPNIAAATDSPGLKAFQSGLDSSNVANYNRSSKMIDDSKAAIDTYYRSAMPTLDDAITPYLKGRHTQAIETTKTRIDAIDRKAAALESAFERQTSRVVGSRLREIKSEQYTKARDEKNRLYDELYDSAKRAKVFADVSDIKRAVKSIKAEDANIFQTMPNIFDKINRLIPGDKLTRSTVVGPDGRPMTIVSPTAEFGPIHSLMKEINKEYGKALRSGDSVKEYYLSKLKPVVNKKIEGFNDPVYGSFAEHKKAVDEWWATEYYNVFKQGLGAKINRKTKIGDRTPDEEVVKAYVMGKGSDGIDQFNKVFQGVPEAQVLLRDGIIDLLGGKIKQSGFKQKVVDDFLRVNKEVMDKLPDLRNALADTGVAVNIMSKRKAEVEDIQRRIVQSSNNVHAKAAGFDDIKEAITSSFNDKKVMRLLSRSAKTKTQKQNLATGYADHVLSKSKPWEFLAENEKKLKPILNTLGSNHYANLKDVANAYKVMDRYNVPSTLSSQSGVGDPVQRHTGTSFISAFAQFRWAFFYGKTSKVYPFVDIGSKYLFKQGQQSVEKLIEKSMYDPDLAKTLASLTKRKVMPLKEWDTLTEKMLGVRLKATGVVSDDVGMSLDEQFRSEIQ